MIDLDWLPNLLGDSDIEKQCDAAGEIEFRYRHVLQQDFDSDVASLQAYLHRVAKLGTLPPFYMQHWTEEGAYLVEEALAELIDTYPLSPEVFKDSDGVYRRSMVYFCSELLKANIAIKTGLTEKAWWHLSRVSFYDGQGQGYYLGIKPAENKRQSGKKGGIAKEVNKQKAARDACIQHLKNDCPPGGWKSVSDAMAIVVPKVEQMIRKEREEIDVRELLYGWLNGDPEVLQAGGFTMLCRKK